jgi:hypothetical protein
MHVRICLPAALVLLAAWPLGSVRAADRFVAYNSTTGTDLTGLALAPAGTQDWGPNQVLNEPDKVLEHSERLLLKGIKRGRYDARLTDAKGRTCLKRGIDLSHDLSFEIRDGDLADCK